MSSYPRKFIRWSRLSQLKWTFKQSTSTWSQSRQKQALTITPNMNGDGPQVRSAQKQSRLTFYSMTSSPLSKLRSVWLLRSSWNMRWSTLGLTQWSMSLALRSAQYIPTSTMLRLRQGLKAAMVC